MRSPQMSETKSIAFRMIFLANQAMQKANTIASHSAPGQLAGYMFQPERALFHLAVAGRGSVVGIETLDDVAVINQQGRVIREQDKHYTSRRAPLSDRSKELWNSLHIWLSAITNEGLDLEKTEFHLVTNSVVSTGLIYDLIELDGVTADVDWKKFVKKLRDAGTTPTKQLKPLIEGVLGHSDKTLIAFAKRIRVTDGTRGSFGSALRGKIADALLLETASVEDVLNGLLGWIHDTTLLLIRNGKPAWFSWEDFGERYRRELFAHCDRKFFRETAAAEIPVTDEDRDKYRQNVFVKQLLWLGLPDDDEQLIEAIDDVYRSITETIRLTKKGVVTPNDFNAFDERLIEKWKALRRSHTPKPLPPDEKSLQDVGKAVLNQAMDHREMLAGQPTQEWYLTRGAFHKLADEPRVGWHPNFQQKHAKFTETEAKHDADNRS